MEGKVTIDGHEVKFGDYIDLSKHPEIIGDELASLLKEKSNGPHGIYLVTQVGDSTKPFIVKRIDSTGPTGKSGPPGDYWLTMQDQFPSPEQTIRISMSIPDVMEGTILERVTGGYILRGEKVMTYFFTDEQVRILKEWFVMDEQYQKNLSDTEAKELRGF